MSVVHTEGFRVTGIADALGAIVADTRGWAISKSISLFGFEPDAPL